MSETEKIMSNLTEKAIKEAFLTLLDKKPIARISVKDIVEECGINRNSFYYHYSDINELVSEIIREEIDNAIGGHKVVNSLEASFEVALSFILDHKKPMYHIFNSLSRDSFEKALLAVCEYGIGAYLKDYKGFGDLSETDRRMIINLYKYETFGAIIDWLNGGMKNDTLEIVKRLREVNEGYLDTVIAKCKEK